MSYALRVACAFFGGVLAMCGFIVAFAVILDAHPEDPRWDLSLVAADLGAGLVAASRVRDDLSAR